MEITRRLPEYLRTRPLPVYPWLRQITWEQLMHLHVHHFAGKRTPLREDSLRMALSDASVIQLAERVARAVNWTNSLPPWSMKSPASSRQVSPLILRNMLANTLTGRSGSAACFRQCSLYRYILALCMKTQGHLLDQTEQRDLAERLFRRMEEQYCEILRLEPEHAGAHNNLAWFLATCPNRQLRNPTQAVELATKAVELKPESGTYQNTFGVAQYRAGDPKGAIQTLENSMKLRSGGDSFDWFFLGMAHWQLHHKEEARRFYDQAVEWMDNSRPDDEELRRFRADAAGLLGLDDEPEPEQHSAPAQEAETGDGTSSEK